MKKKKERDLNIVGIHASILSIIIAILSTYGLFVFGNLDELEYRAFSESEKINSIELTYKYRSPRHQFKHLIDTPPKQQYKSVLKQLWDITYYDLMNTVQGDKKKEVDNAEVGIQLLCNLTVLQNIYPYATRISFVPDGKVLDKINIDRVEFNSLDDIRIWVKDVDSVLQNALFIYLKRKGKLDEIISAATLDIEKKMRFFGSAGELDEKFSSGDKKDMLNWRKSMATGLVNNFFQNIAKTQEIFINTKKIIEDHDLYKNRHINKAIFLVGLILAFFAFIVSVIFPLIFKKVPKLFKIWIPVSVYFMIFLYLILKILLL